MPLGITGCRRSARCSRLPLSRVCGLRGCPRTDESILRENTGGCPVRVDLSRPIVGTRTAGIGAQGKYAGSQRNFCSALLKQPFAAPAELGGRGVSISYARWVLLADGLTHRFFFGAAD